MKPEIVVIGSSAGGLPALKEILQHWQPPLPVPVIVAQHLSSESGHNAAEWLHVQVMEPVQSLESGRVYLIPPGYSARITAPGQAHLTRGVNYRGIYPSVDLLFATAARHYGSRAVGILLSGMGRDGVEGLTKLHNVGAMTIVQNHATAAIDGMNRRAREKGLADYDLAPGEIAELVKSRLDLFRGA